MDQTRIPERSAEPAILPLVPLPSRIAAFPSAPAQAAPPPCWFYRKTILPLLTLLRLGATPERLAWSLAAGVLIGVNPVLGSTTLVCLAVACLFRLNIAASQITTHLLYPLELLLLLPFVHLGTRVFGTAPLPLSVGALLQTARHAPLALFRQIWMWEWHALVVWAAFASLAAPLLAAALTPALRKLLADLQQHPAPRSN